MTTEAAGIGFKIWAVDNQVYGPVELPTLVSWVKDERVTADTWIFSEPDDAWHKAAQMPELKLFFKPAATGASHDTPVVPGRLKPGSLRRIRILADLSDSQLERFVPFTEVHP